MPNYGPSEECVGKHRVARLMRQLRLKTRGQRRFRATLQRNEAHRCAPNLTCWVAISRRIVGWSMSERMTKELVCDAWRMAVGRYGTPPMHHSDQGSQYTSDDYLSPEAYERRFVRDKLTIHPMRVSSETHGGDSASC